MVPEYQQKVKQELADLLVKRDALAAFLERHDLHGVSPTELYLLNTQLITMNSYAAILRARINSWQKA